MFSFSRVALSLDWLVAIAWLWRVLSWRIGMDRVPDLSRIESQPAASRPALPKLSVIVPARNEAEDIAATLESLLASNGVAPEIIAVDDRSEDDTGAIIEEIAAHAAARGKTLRVLHVSELPRGWLGKTHAMALAARHATGEWLLFTDADIRFREDALRRALEFAVANSADHFVLMPTLVLKTPGERMIMSYMQVIAIWAVRLWRVPDPRATRDALGVGAFNLVRREVYDAAGGWEALRMEVIEDLTFGIRIKQMGFAQRVALGRDLISLRWIQGAFGIVDNLAKNLFAVFRFRAVALFGFLPIFLLFTLFPLATAFTVRGAGWPACVMLFALALAYGRQARYQPFTVFEVLLFPVASVVIFYTLLRSMIVVVARGGIFWRGTFYPLNELRKKVDPAAQDP